MRFLNSSLLMLLSLFTALFLIDAHAASDPVTLSTLTVMTEDELRAETIMPPLQEQTSQKKALNMRLMKIERELQDYTVNANFVQNIEILPLENQPRLDLLPPGLQQFVLAIADGLRSSDPRNGIYVILAPFGIDRNATNVQRAREQFNQNNVDRTLLNQWCAANGC